MYSFLHSRRDFVSRRVRHAHIEYRSAKVVKVLMKRRPRARTLPVVILGKLFCLLQGRLDGRWKELRSPDSV